MGTALEDAFGRRFTYLRLSITEACNFRCVYCLPNGYKKTGGEGFLEISEIKNLTEAFAGLGTRKVRLSGGEPTLRPDFLEIASAVSSVAGIETVALSTNGYRLAELAPHLRTAGVNSINVSLDSLHDEDFRAMTGSKFLPQIRAGIDAAFHEGFEHIKVNAVLMRGWFENALEGFLDWARREPVTVRFIELMETGDNRELFLQQHLAGNALRLRLEQQGWRLRARGETDGPALEFDHPDYRGRMGLIAPYSKDFCSTCNRLRVTSRGALRLCLFGDGQHSLRDLLQHPSQKEELQQRLRELVRGKEISHFLQEGKYGNNFGFSRIGG